MAVDLPSAVFAFIAALESVSGVQIAVLDRIEKTELFWARSAAILCQKTGENFCSEDVRFMTANTEPLGQSHIIEYKVGQSGQPRRVCAVIPPIPNIDPASVAEAYGQPHPGLMQVPTSTEAAAWLMLYHVSHCLDTELSDAEESRAGALATLALTLLEGEPRFTAGVHRSPARMMAVMTGRASAYWAAGTGERILLDMWKNETATVLRDQYNCYAIVSQNASIDIESIRRDPRLPIENTCASGQDGYVSTQVNVTDSNLWLWMYGQDGYGGIGAPPITYTPMKGFTSMEEGARYVLTTANQLAN